MRSSARGSESVSVGLNVRGSERGSPEHHQRGESAHHAYAQAPPPRASAIADPPSAALRAPALTSIVAPEGRAAADRDIATIYNIGFILLT